MAVGPKRDAAVRKQANYIRHAVVNPRKAVKFVETAYGRLLTCSELADMAAVDEKTMSAWLKKEKTMPDAIVKMLAYEGVLETLRRRAPDEAAAFDDAWAALDPLDAREAALDEVG